MKKKLSGTGVAIVTPFHKYGTIDFTALGRLVEHVITGGVDYIVVLGTTGENATLSKDEKNAVIDFVIETTNKRVPIVLGAGGNNTQEVINFIRSISFEGIDAILSVAPYYNKPQQKGLFLHYKAIAAASPVPVILYNVPGRTSVNLSAETTLKLAREIDNIVAVKEASGNMEQVMEIIAHKPTDFLVLSGDDALTLSLLAMGADGVISVVANAFPQQFSDMVRFGRKGQMEQARKMHYLLFSFIKTLFVDGNPAGVKAALDVMGIMQNNLRLPLAKVNKSVYFTLKEQIAQIQAAIK